MRSNAELADALASFAQDSMLAPEDRETVTQAAAALRAGVPEGWRDISSAPRDGTAILAHDGYYTLDGRTGPPTTVRWENGYREGWHLCEYGAHAEDSDYDAKFWQPLPAPPEG